MKDERPHLSITHEVFEWKREIVNYIIQCYFCKSIRFVDVASFDSVRLIKIMEKYTLTFLNEFIFCNVYIYMYTVYTSKKK